MARPEKEIDEKVVRELARIHCTIPEIAAVVGCSEDTLHRRFQEVIDQGKAQGRASLRRKQVQLAEQGNSALLIWLGKNLLGQKDKSPEEIEAMRGQIASPIPQERLIELVKSVRGSKA